MRKVEYFEMSLLVLLSSMQSITSLIQSKFDILQGCYVVKD